MDVIHLVAKIGDPITTTDDNNANNSLQSSSPQQQQQPFQHALITTTISRERRLRHPDAAVLTVDKQQVFETIHQSILAINNILECDDHFNCFNINKRKLVLGQWIDVKDTVYEWLEAEVIDINEEKKEVYVHYNGWGARWDEWLPMDSDRIMPFRFHTRQLTALHTLSPYPNKPLLDGIKLVTDKEEEEGFDGMVNKTIDIMNICLEQMKGIVNKKNKDNKEMQLDYYYKIKKMLPLLDRTGRLMTDLSVYANECVKPSNLKDLNRSLYKSKENEVNVHNDKDKNDNTNTTNASTDDSMLTDMLKGYSEDFIKNTSLEFFNTLAPRERRSTRYIPARNKYDELFKNQIPLNDLPSFVNHYHSVLSRPLYDIYVHEIPQSTYEALNALSNRNENNNETNTNNESNNINLTQQPTNEQQQQQPNTSTVVQNETNIMEHNVSESNVNNNNTPSNNNNNNECDDIIVEDVTTTINDNIEHNNDNSK